MKDAPRMWRIRLGQELEKLGLKPLQADKSIYCKWNLVGTQRPELVLIVSTHVDDLKGGGVKSEVERLITQLEKSFGKGKLHYGKDTFEHCGGDSHTKSSFQHYDKPKPLCQAAETN